MRKIFSFLCLSLLAFGMAGCDKDDDKDNEQEKVVTFAEYLEAAEFTAAKLDSAVGEVTLPTVTETDEYLTALDITNSKLTINLGGEDEYEAYAWKKTVEGDEVLYFAGPFGENDADVIGSINLTTIDAELAEIQAAASEGMAEYEAMIEMILADTDESGIVEFSEVIDNALTMAGMDTTAINTDKILSEIKFDINDFEDKGDGNYQLKLSSLVDIAEAIYGTELPIEQEQIDAMSELMQITVNYAENHINKVSLNVLTIDMETEDVTTMNLAVAFEYAEDEISKTTLSLVSDAEEMYASMVVAIEAGKLSLDVKAGTSPTAIESDMHVAFGYSNGKFTTEITMDDMLEADFEIIGTWISSANIDMTIPEGEDFVYSGLNIVASLESNVDVTVNPAYVAMEDEAFDFTDMLLEMLASSMTPVQPVQ